MTSQGAEDPDDFDDLFDENGNVKPLGGEGAGNSSESGKALVREVLAKPERVRLQPLYTETNPLEWRICFDHLDEDRQAEIREAVDRAFRSTQRVVEIKGPGPELEDEAPGKVVARAGGFRDHHRWMHTLLTRLQTILIEDCAIALYQDREAECDYLVDHGFRLPPGGRLPWAEEDKGA